MKYLTSFFALSLFSINSFAYLAADSTPSIYKHECSSQYNILFNDAHITTKCIGDIALSTTSLPTVAILDGETVQGSDSQMLDLLREAKDINEEAQTAADMAYDLGVRTDEVIDAVNTIVDRDGFEALNEQAIKRELGF